MAEDVKQATTRVYVVLARATVDAGFSVAGEYDVANEDAALTAGKAANSGGPDGPEAEWVAVPKRYWRPRKPTTTTKVIEGWS